MPSYSNVESFFADYLLVTEKNDQAFEYSKKAYDNNKESFLNWIEMALAYYFNNENENSYEIIQRAREIFPKEWLVVTNFIRLSVYMEKYDMALEEFEKSNIDVDPDSIPTIRLGHAGIAYFASGNKNKSSDFLNELLRRGEKSVIGSPLFYAAEIYTARKDYDNAIQTLEKSYANHEVELYWLNAEPIFRTLHGDPRFENILKKIGFTQ
jgi:tetratricopeptide (TPR) repeat protein